MKETLERASSMGKSEADLHGSEIVPLGIELVPSNSQLTLPIDLPKTPRTSESKRKLSMINKGKEPK